MPERYKITTKSKKERPLKTGEKLGNSIYYSYFLLASSSLNLVRILILFYSTRRMIDPTKFDDKLNIVSVEGYNTDYICNIT